MESYGVHEKEKAEALAEYLQAIHPENQYEVAIHDRRAPNWMHREPVRREPAMWGVIKYVPSDLRGWPWRCEGFVWWDYSRPIPSLGLLNRESSPVPA